MAGPEAGQALIKGFVTVFLCMLGISYDGGWGMTFIRVFFGMMMVGRGGGVIA